MYLAYIDGSGRPEKKCEPNENFVLSAVITHESQWIYIDNIIKGIKLKHFPRIHDENFELHVKDMQNKSGVFKGLTFDEIYAIHDDVFNALAQ